MKNKLNELVEELKTVIKGKTLDAILPLLMYTIIQSFTSLNVAIILTLITAMILGIVRALLKHVWTYALFGFLSVLVASSFAFYAQNASDFFLPGLIGSSALLILTLLTVILNRPLAAFASHITRGFPLSWYWHPMIKPAYREVTYLWTIYLLLRFLVQGYAFLQDNVVRLTWLNIVTGFPLTIVVLMMSYIYGIWRLNRLRGPSVEEFLNDAQPPFSGQKRGF